MLSRLAAALCILTILYLFRKDLAKCDGPSNALWVPLTWMFLAGSRYVSSWLNLGTPLQSADAYTEGSSVDAVVFFSLIVAAVGVLSRRNIDWHLVLLRNKLIWVYFLYCGVSIVWSDIAFVSFKRWIKELGNPIMALVILTEDRPYEAVGVLLRRLAFLLLPLSILFIRYYPDLGRSYWQGQPMFTGVAHQKNGLGQLCLVSGIYFSWNFFLNRKERLAFGNRDNIIDIVFLLMLAYLLHMAQSATSTACSVVAVGLFYTGRLKAIVHEPTRIIYFGIIIVSLFLFLNWLIDVKGFVIGLLGRDTDLTSRVPIWQMLKGMVTNPLVGTGFMSFWGGHRLEILWGRVGATIIQAHNGYLEQYLNLGFIGVAFIIGIMVTGLLKVRNHLYLDYPSALLRLCFIVCAALYNYTEASFYGINNMWILLLLGSIDVCFHNRQGVADQN